MSAQPAAAAPESTDVADHRAEPPTSVPVEDTTSQLQNRPSTSPPSHASSATAPATLAASLFDGVKAKITGLQVGQALRSAPNSYSMIACL